MNAHSSIIIHTTIQPSIVKILRNNTSIGPSLNNKLRVTLNPKINPMTPMISAYKAL